MGRVKKKKEKRIELSPTQSEYVMSDAIVNVLVSNTGEGKTFASVVAMIVHAQKCGRAIRCAIVRDTHENIKNSTAKSIKEDFGDICRFWNDDKKCVLYTNPRVYIDLFGIADEGALTKLQGNEYALIWLEEPAPMTSKANAGLSEDVFNAAMVRAVRQKLPPYCANPACGDTPAHSSSWLGESDEQKAMRRCELCGSEFYWPHGRLQVSMNPADEEHWTFRRLIEEGPVDPKNLLVTKAVWFVAYGENVHVTELSRQMVKSAYKDDPASYMRYVMGKFAPVYKGAKVSPEFNPMIHVSEVPLEPAAGLVSFRFWDGWHNPTCVMGQVTRTGRLIILDVMRLEGGDVASLIEYQVDPMMESPRWRDKAFAWRDIGDVSMANPDQSNIQTSNSKVIEGHFGTRFEKGPHIWALMKTGVKKALNRMIQGMPAVFINCECKLLIKGLAGGWHYKTDNSNNIIGTLPVKNEISHVCDAWANGVNVLLPSRTFDDRKGEIAKLQKKMKDRAASYVTPV